MSFNSVDVRVRGTQSLRLLGIVLRTLDALLSFWYHVNVSRYVPCICQACSSYTQHASAYAFPVTLCEAAVSDGQYLLECERTGARVRLDKLMPDLMLMDIEDSSQITVSEFQKQRELGKGSYGQIFAGVWRVSACECVFVYACVGVCVCVCLCGSVCLCVCLCGCVTCAHVHACLCICTCVHVVFV